ncbi:MAG TPA: hypothetical protein VG797_06850, partial [Phycisphaerales bacterium]|nr:hypothetical protein [Phycisphaerales bacterium]
IIKQKLVGKGTVISSAAAMRLAATERFGEPMSIVEIGRRVGAEVVLYVRIQNWTLARDVGSISPAVQANVKIIDTVKNERLWPEGSNGYPMQMTLPVQTKGVPTSLDERAALEDKVAARFGLEIARLFYDHERSSVGDKNLTDPMTP